MTAFVYGSDLKTGCEKDAMFLLRTLPSVHVPVFEQRVR